jgi:hypothetical protein
MDRRRAALLPVSEVGHPTGARIWLEVNGIVVQEGTLDEMIWPVADIISYISRFVTLAPGDLIFSGTLPALVHCYRATTFAEAWTASLLSNAISAKSLVRNKRPLPIVETRCR